jgi:hypothetical protein
MKRIQLFIACSLLVFGSAAMAQVKFDIKEHCPKESVSHKLDVGDVPDHSYWIGQGTCNATASNSSFAEKTSDWTEFREIWKTSMNYHGRAKMTMDNGDKVYITYEGSASTDITKPFTFKWKILSGTGKYTGIKGSGTTSMKFNADGSADGTGTGTYSLGK